MNRVEHVHIVSKRLIVMTALAIAVLSAIFGATFLLGERLMLTYLAFTCGIIGGFVSIQQRLKSVSDEELELLARSWFQIVLIPIFGGVFALVLYCLFLSGIVSGHVFPAFTMPKPATTGPDNNFMIDLLTKTYPSTGPDLAKLLFWSFVAGFSERFVPQIITKVAAGAGGDDGKDGGKKDEDRKRDGRKNDGNAD
jgi:hypothetical protein